jgi:hypothetical protein
LRRLGRPETKAKVGGEADRGQVNLKTRAQRRRLPPDPRRRPRRRLSTATPAPMSLRRQPVYRVSLSHRSYRPQAGDSTVTPAPQTVDVRADNSFSNIIELPGVPVLVSPEPLRGSGDPTTEFRWREVEEREVSRSPRSFALFPRPHPRKHRSNVHPPPRSRGRDLLLAGDRHRCDSQLRASSRSSL